MFNRDHCGQIHFYSGAMVTGWVGRGLVIARGENLFNCFCAGHGFCENHLDEARCVRAGEFRGELCWT